MGYTIIGVGVTKRIIITNGLALFAMFFGAGNIIYPLALGAQGGDHILYVTLAFLVSGIGLPFLGLFATSLYNGDYWSFFSRLGKVPAFLLIAFLILFIGPLCATPRTETIAFQTLQPFLPSGLSSPYVFSALYCLAIFCLTYRHTKIVDLIGYFLSPIKLVLFAVLIVAGLLTTQDIFANKNTIMESVQLGLVNGYSTMDLLAAFFFCAVVYKSILAKAKSIGITDQKETIKIFLYSCLIGAALLAVVYVGFMLLAYSHATQLQGVDTAQMIVVISKIVLGKSGAFFVGVCVSFACLVTAIALTEVTTGFFHEHVFMKKVPRLACLLTTIVLIYAMSILGFSEIMRFSLPILEVLYPVLIVYCVVNITIKLVSDRKSAQIKVLPSVSAETAQ
jgi:LIVCS family branched-chain amino acid:cation transporter